MAIFKRLCICNRFRVKRNPHQIGVLYEGPLKDEYHNSQIFYRNEKAPQKNIGKI